MAPFTGHEAGATGAVEKRLLGLRRGDRLNAKGRRRQYGRPADVVADSHLDDLYVWPAKMNTGTGHVGGWATR